MTSCRATDVVEGLARKYYVRVHAFARQLTDANTAEDITQEVFTRLLTIEGIEEREINVSYLLKAAHNLVRGLHRKETRARRHSERVRSNVRAIQPAPRTPGTAIDQAGDLTALERSLLGLTPNERDALELTVFRGLSLKDASEALGVRVTTITNWKYRGLRKLGRSRDGEGADERAA